MSGAISREMSCVQYELEIQIDAPLERVWRALTDEIDAWWLGDFHMVDPNSTVEFDVRVGGRGLIEYRPDGSFLLWYSVQAFLPEQHKIYLVGNLAPDFGGPSTTNLSLSLVARDDGCTLRITDAHHGCVDESTVASLKNGWQQLFNDGLRKYSEREN